MKNIIVTGATKGIGKAIVLKFASNGFNVAFCSRSEANVKALKAEIEQLNNGIDIIALPCDVSIKEQVVGFGKQVLSKWSSVDVLVNNAGVFFPGEVLNEDDDVLEKMISTNVYSAYHLSRLIAPNMINAKRGHIFNMCSVASLKAYPNGGSYSISKFALLGLSKALREELKEKNVRVTTIMPGATLTPSWDGVDLPETRFMKADDIAQSTWDIYNLSERTVVEDIVLRPQLGDI